MVGRTPGGLPTRPTRTLAEIAPMAGGISQVINPDDVLAALRSFYL